MRDMEVATQDSSKWTSSLQCQPVLGPHLLASALHVALTWLLPATGSQARQRSEWGWDLGERSQVLTPVAH